MSNKPDQTNPEKGDTGTSVHCRRTGQSYSPDEHAQCPYCFGKKAEVETGEHEQFCDFDEKRDPINFGFPPDSYRNNSG